MKTVFVTGTDTEVGKTYFSEMLLQQLADQEVICAGFKPVAAGCEHTDKGLRNEDALSLMDASSLELDYDLVNPIAFQDPVAPHLAAKNTNKLIDIDIMQETFDIIQSQSPDFVLVEGAGGWQLPLGRVRINGKLSAENYFMPHFVNANSMPVILVVGMKLGCLNHAIMSYRSIVDSGCQCIGWVANQIDPSMEYYSENLESLDDMLPVPRLAEINYGQKANDFSFNFDFLSN